MSVVGGDFVFTVDGSLIVAIAVGAHGVLMRKLKSSSAKSVVEADFVRMEKLKVFAKSVVGAAYFISIYFIYSRI